MENNNQNLLNEDKGLSIFDLFQIIKRRMLSIIICVGLFFGLMVVYSYTIQKPIYSTSATVMVNPSEQGSSSTINNDYTYIQRIMSTYEILFTSRLVLGEVSENIQNYQKENGDIVNLRYSYGQIRSMTSISVEQGSSAVNVDSLVFRVTVTGYNAEDCAIIANEIIKVTKSLPSVEGDFAILRKSTLTSVDDALPNYAYSKNVFRNGIIGIALGMVAAAGYIIIREMTDTTLADARTAEELLDLNVLAIIPDYELFTEKRNYEEDTTEEDENGEVVE